MSVLWRSSDIARAVGGTCTGVWEASGVSIDSRNIKPGDVFVALKGPQFDGHDYVKAALAAGASGAIISRAIEGVSQEKCVLAHDVFEALSALGRAGRARATGTILAVTGSVGKTGCKEALRQVLAAQAETYANEGSFNNHWGAPLSLSRLPPAATYGVFELGMNHVGELGPLAQMVAPHISLITTIAAVHIGNFSGLDEIASAKAEIFEGVGASGHAVLNADNSYFDFLTSRAREKGISNIHSFGKNGRDARLVSFTLSENSSAVEAEILGKKIVYTVGAPGEHWVFNSLAVLLCAGLAGADIGKASETLAHLSLAEGRGVPEVVEAAGGPFTLIDESYNASPIATEMAIKVLARKQPAAGGRRLLALGDMRELGEHSRALHIALATQIKDAGIDRVFCCGEHMKHLYDALPTSMQGAYAFTSTELAPLVASAIQPHDIITIKGSKSMGMHKVVDALRTLAPQSRQPHKKTA